MGKLTLTVITILFCLTSVAWSANLQKGLDAYQNGDFATAFREWKTLAEQGDARARTLLGWMYYEGKGVPQDYKTAVKWFGRAAEQGDADVQTLLGLMYSHIMHES